MVKAVCLLDGAALRGEPALLRFFWDLFAFTDYAHTYSPFWAQITMVRMAGLMDASQVGDAHIRQLICAMRDLLLNEDCREFRHAFEEQAEEIERERYDRLCARLNRYCDEKITVDYRTMKPEDSSIVTFNMQQMLRIIDPENEYSVDCASELMDGYHLTLGPWEDMTAQYQMEIAQHLSGWVQYHCPLRESYLEIPGDPEESRARRRRILEIARPFC